MYKRQGQRAAFIDCAVFTVPLKVDVIHKAAELVVNVVATLKEVVTTEDVYKRQGLCRPCGEDAKAHRSG